MFDALSSLYIQGKKDRQRDGRTDGRSLPLSPWVQYISAVPKII
jgi:hypothetical protein